MIKGNTKSGLYLKIVSEDHANEVIRANNGILKDLIRALHTVRNKKDFQHFIGHLNNDLLSVAVNSLTEGSKVPTEFLMVIFGILNKFLNLEAERNTDDAYLKAQDMIRRLETMILTDADVITQSPKKGKNKVTSSGCTDDQEKVRRPGVPT